MLANNFIQFFIEKVNKIQVSLPSSTPPVESWTVFPEPIPGSSFISFAVVTQKEVAELVKESPIKLCALDLIPVSLSKALYPILVPALTTVINVSLQSGVVLSSLKEAQLIPILTKYNLDVEVLNNYRPISNLPYLSKLIEHEVPLQSAYSKFHSTETAIVYVLNDLL